MAINFVISSAVISIIFGFLILIFPKFLRYFIGIYFIIVGIIGMISQF